MSKAFGLALMLVALYITMTLYTKGMERAFGGIFAPIAPSEREVSLATHLTPAAQAADAPGGGATRPRVKITDAVRNRVSSDLRAGAERRGY